MRSFARRCCATAAASAPAGANYSTHDLALLQTLGTPRPTTACWLLALYINRHQPPALRPAGADLAAVSGAAALGQPRLVEDASRRDARRPGRVRGARPRQPLAAVRNRADHCWRRYDGDTGLRCPPEAGIRRVVQHARPLTDRDAPLPASDELAALRQRPQLRRFLLNDGGRRAARTRAGPLHRLRSGRAACLHARTGVLFAEIPRWPCRGAGSCR